MTALFSPWTVRGVTFPNRIGMSPMCMYSAHGDGMPNEWHTVHLTSRAIGGAGVVFVEATGVSPEGRITPGCLGIWSDEHADALAPLARMISEYGAVPGIQLAHAGRKGGRTLAWEGNLPLTDDEWMPRIGPSPVAFKEGWAVPVEMDEAAIQRVVREFGDGARRAASAGFKILEAHFAHGYLMHQFLSPLSNFRTDAYGGSLENRARFPLMAVRAMREAWPDDLPLSIRLSIIDWVPGGITIEESIQVARWMGEEGVDIIDCSSGFVVPGEEMPPVPLYHGDFARRVRAEAGVPTAVVGGIVRPEEAQQAIDEGMADLVLVGRAMLRDPYWARTAATALDRHNDLEIPVQYRRSVERLRD